MENQKVEVVPKINSEDAGNLENRLLGLPSYNNLSVLLIIVASFISYFVSTKWSPNAFSIAPIYFLIVILAGLVFEVLILLLSTKLAKISGRNLEKILFSASGVNFINSVFSVVRIPFYSNYKWITIALATVFGIATWYFVKRVFGIKNKEVSRLSLWIAMVILAVVIVAGFVGSLLFSTELKKLGIDQ